ncbi:hypothetical protein AMECASPLE_038267 [Ameca splendens]|uniref:Uncharacterized protein n=1 Tax=Ameca splendens TaxID=208324 RepID=A0ABV1AH56_9TELE
MQRTHQHVSCNVAEGDVRSPKSCHPALTAELRSFSPTLENRKNAIHLGSPFLYGHENDCGSYRRNKTFPFYRSHFNKTVPIQLNARHYLRLPPLYPKCIGYIPKPYKQARNKLTKKIKAAKIN